MQKSMNDFFDKDETSYLNWIRKKRQSNLNAKKIVDYPKPILKWAGGKRQLISQISDHLPKEFDTYFEPFVGGGALFFYLLPEKGILVDNNPVLINVYTVVKNNVEILIKSLRKHRNEKEYYYELRNLDRNENYNKISTIEKASRTIFLNKTCFNGLYRVNSKGQFNVPFGKYKNPNYCDEKNLRTVSKILQNTKIYHDSFEKVLELAKTKDFIYFDPPYIPISKTANFTSYTKENFTIKDQETLAQLFEKLDEKGCYVLLSNSYSDFILERYKEFQITPVQAKRAINSDASKRGSIKEVLVKNY